YNALSVRYIRGDAVDELFARVAGSTAAWYLTDNEGSTRDLYTTTGIQLDHYDYNPYGTILFDLNNFAERFLYTGREWDTEIGYEYDRARYYNPVDGRFLSQDPAGFAAGDPNLYQYAGNSPTLATDPSGLVMWVPGRGTIGLGLTPDLIEQYNAI